LAEIYDYLNIKYTELKDQILNHYCTNYTPKEKERVWNNVTKVYNDILHPLVNAVHQNTEANKGPPVYSQSNTLNYAINAYLDARKNEATANWPTPVEINFLRLKDPNDVATIKCRIGSMAIPYALTDTGSNTSIITKNVANQLGLEIDTTNVPEISGVANLAKTVGTIYNLLITIGYGDNMITVTDEFAVVEPEKNKKGEDKSLVLLGIPWLHRVGWEPIVKGEFKASYDGKKVTIPLSIHRAQREVFIAEAGLAEPVKKSL
jgi:hypothetical protein